MKHLIYFFAILFLASCSPQQKEELPVFVTTVQHSLEDRSSTCSSVPYFDGTHRLFIKIANKAAGAPTSMATTIVGNCPSNGAILNIPVTLVNGQFVEVEIPEAPNGDDGWTLKVVNQNTTYSWLVSTCEYGFNKSTSGLTLPPKSGPAVATPIVFTHHYPWNGCLTNNSLFVTKPWCTANVECSVTKLTTTGGVAFTGASNAQCGTTGINFSYSIANNAAPGNYIMNTVLYPLTQTASILDLGALIQEYDISISRTGTIYSGANVEFTVDSYTDNFALPLNVASGTRSYQNDGDCIYYY